MAEDNYDDPELQKFAEENREMIEKLMAAEKAKRAEEAARQEQAQRDAHRSAQQRYEEAMARESRAERMESAAREGGERAYDTYRYARARTEDAFDEGIDHLRDRGDYAYRTFREEMDRARAYAEQERLRAFDRMDEDRARFREDRERVRRYINEDVSDAFGFFADPKFQQHLVGAGLEMWMALNSLIRNSPAPDFMKEFMQEADRNKNVEYCRKNEYCRSKRNPDAPRYREGGEDFGKRPADASDGPQPIIIKSAPKKEDAEKKDGL